MAPDAYAGGRRRNARDGRTAPDPCGIPPVARRRAEQKVLDLSHLDALQERLRRERARLDDAVAAQAGAGTRRVKALEAEAAFRRHEIAACEREIAGEHIFLGIPPVPASIADLSDDELLEEPAC